MPYNLHLLFMWGASFLPWNCRPVRPLGWWKSLEAFIVGRILVETSTKYVVGRLKGRKRVGRLEFFLHGPKILFHWPIVVQVPTYFSKMLEGCLFFLHPIFHCHDTSVAHFDMMSFWRGIRLRHNPTISKLFLQTRGLNWMMFYDSKVCWWWISFIGLDVFHAQKGSGWFECWVRIEGCINMWLCQEWEI